MPVADNDGLVFTDAHHLKVYRLIFKISGGSTDNPWSSGKWINDGRVYKDRVIPLEFLATTEEADRIAAFALVHYEQIEIVCVPISDAVRRYRRVPSSPQVLDAVQETLTKQLPDLREENPCACEQLHRRSVTSSGEPSQAEGLPPVSKAARPLSEGASSPDSIQKERAR